MDPEMGIWVVSACGARCGRDTRNHQLPKEACLGTVEQGAAAQSINERTHGNSVTSLPRADAIFTQRNCMLHKCYTCRFKLQCLYNSFYFRVHFECMGTFYCGSENKLVTNVGKNNNIGTANIVNHRHVYMTCSKLLSVPHIVRRVPKEKKEYE